MQIVTKFSGCLTVLVLFAAAVSNSQAQYSGGTGEPNDPYQIATAADLIALGDSPADYDKHFLLTADLDLDWKLPGRRVFDKAVLAPDVDPVKPDYQGTGFAGVLDGKGHTIAHLTITGGGYLGLLGRLASAAQVRNLGVVDVNIVGSDSYVGGLAGESSGSIATSYSTGAVKGRNGVGGLVGSNAGSVTRCYSTSAAVSNTGWWVGGLVGTNSGGLDTSYSAGRISATNSVGGLVGFGNSGTVTQCYSTSAVTGTSLGVGGLMGYNGATAVTQCYSAGAVSGGAPGGLMGINHGEVTGCFWDIQTSGQSTSKGGTGKTTAEMQTATTFLKAGWDFVGETANGTEDIWRILEGQDYPCLSWEGPRTKYGGGSGTAQDPYQIRTAEQMNTIGASPNDWGRCFKLMADIDLSGFDGKQGRPAFKIIGTSTQSTFTGVFDGNGHTISGLTINGGSCLGLFGQLKYPAEVKDLGLLDINVTTGSWVSSVGGLVGSNGHYSGSIKGGTIINCYSTGTVSGSGPQSNSFGGLVGSNYGEVSQCYSTAAVTGSWDSGGLVGSNGTSNFAQGVVRYCYSTGTVRSASASVGGLAGTNYGTVTCCYSTGAVSGGSSSPWAGGLLGSNHGTVTNCYSTGAVKGTGWYVGGLTCWSMGTITNCFWNTQTSGQTTSSGGTGKTTAQMQTAKTFLDAGWDFVGETTNGTEDIWWINEGKDYPRLWWEVFQTTRNVVEVEEADFDQAIAVSVPVLVSFYTKGCPLCLMMTTVVNEIADEYIDRAKVYKVNIDNAPNLANRLAVTTAPTFILFRDGVEKRRWEGIADRQELTTVIDELLSSNIRPDQTNLPKWTGGWTLLWPKSGGQARMWQTFTPRASSLTAVDIDIITGNPGFGDDILTVEIAKDGAILTSVLRSVEDGYDGLLRFQLKSIVTLTVGESYELRVSAGGATFGWRYGLNAYSGGMRYFNSQAKPDTDWFFQTYSLVLGD